ncbi:MAG: hypothetical protein WA081_16690 [Desulfosalsimonadaceae bacterium]
MARTTTLKRTQIQGKKYDLPGEDVELEKLIQKGITLDAKIRQLNKQLEKINDQVITIAKSRRDGSTTVNLKAVSGAFVVTFRETYEASQNVEEIRQDLGALFERFFQKKISFKTTKDLKIFLEGEHAHGLNDPESIKTLISAYIQKKETKPNVKLVPAE